MAQGSPAQVGAARGEALNVHAVDAWLKGQLPELHGLPVVTQYSGGASNWTYRLRYANRDLVLRRAPAGTKAKGAHDMAREFTVQQALAPAFPVVPTMVALCRDHSVIGTDFYVMERIEGLVPRSRMPEGLQLDAAGNRLLCVHLIEKLIELHAIDPVAVGLQSLGRGPGYPTRQVEGWTNRYQQARSWNVPRFSYVCDWLGANVPDDSGSCIIHNDWRLDNVIVAPTQPTSIIGVLDWEMATIGDPLMDLGNALAYWVEAGDDRLMRATRRQPTHLPGMLRRQEVVELYLDRTGRRPDEWTFYEVFGVFRLAVIVQQIYYRYHHGQTRNPAFRHFWLLVHYLHHRCRRMIRRGAG